MAGAFDQDADSYDQWYDSPEGRIVFEAELACLRLLCPQHCGRWLEVGVGTGRFADALGVREGIDPSRRMLELAARRGIETYRGRAEALPIRGSSFGGVLLALTLCFVTDAERALNECRQVLVPEGRLLLGIVPSDSPWGRVYRRKAAEGHPIYAQARFRTASETVALVESVGFELRDAASTLFWEPKGTPEIEPSVKPAIVPEAGFVGLFFARAGRRPQHCDESGSSR